MRPQSWDHTIKIRREVSCHAEVSLHTASREELEQDLLDGDGMKVAGVT